MAAFEDTGIAPWDEADLCVVCPGQVHDPGRFDIADGPLPGSAYDTSAGYRRDTVTGVPICMHPEKIGYPPGRYASDNVPFPGRGEPAGNMPDDPGELMAWMVRVLRSAGPTALDSAVRRAESSAAVRFAPEVVLDALRRALSSL